jgi:hypothetical protein
MAKRGRPTIYTEELVSEIFRRMAEGESAVSICKDPRMPTRSTLFDWASKNKEFSDRYDEARMRQCLYWVEEIDDIAKGEGDDEAKQALTARDRLRVDTRKWMASKVVPKLYGDKITQEHTGPEGKELKSFVLAPTISSIAEWRKAVDEAQEEDDEPNVGC